MTRLDPGRYVEHLREDSVRFRTVLADCDPGAPVPSCPEWTAADLLWHLAGVQWFWGEVIGRRPAGPEESWRARDRPADRAALLAFFDVASARLSDALDRADPTDAAWSWSAEQTVGFTVRRQAHEALIHRLDAEQAAGEVTGLDPALAADGVAELMEVMYGGTPPPWASFTPARGTVELHLTDVDVRLHVQPGHLAGVDPGSGHDITGPHVVVSEATTPPSATVSGTAADVDAWLWRRRDDGLITARGDPATYDHFRAAVDQPVD